MATVKILLYKSKQKADGRFPIALRVTKDRKSRYIYLDWIKEDEWDLNNCRVKSSHPNHKRLNNYILRKQLETEDLILEAESKKESFSASKITRLVKGDRKNITFFRFADEYLQDLKIRHKYTRLNNESGKLRQVKRFLRNEDIPFIEVNESFLKRLRAHLIGSKGLSERTVMNTFVIIRTIYNQAIREGIVERKNYPFGKYKIKIKFPDSVKIGLEEGEISKLENLDLLKGSIKWHSRNLFLFSFYMAGMRISDILRLQWSDIKDGRLVYRMQKNQKVDSLKIPSKACSILDQYVHTKKEKYIFPELNSVNDRDERQIYVRTRSTNSKVNKHLKDLAKLAEIDKNISMHIARHSFGNIAGDRISPHMLQKLYRHTSLITTIGYQGNFIHKSADQALESVVGE